jgi:hypothetical protein
MDNKIKHGRGSSESAGSFPLTAKPLLIDVLVIEYKSPGSYVSTADFHKVYAYALL